MKDKFLKFIDNCPAHPHVHGLKAITLAFLPANTTSKLQPCDQGIINNLKVFYRKKIIQELLSHIDSGSTEPFQLTLYDALKMLASSWRQVKTSTIANCFHKAGFLTSLTRDCLQQEDLTEQAEQEEINVGNIWEKLGASDLNLPAGLSMDDFFKADDNVVTSAAPTEKEVVDTIVAERDNTDTNESSEEVDDCGDTSIITSSKAVEGMKWLSSYLIQNNADAEILQMIDRIENVTFDIALKTKMQTKVTNYFEKIN